MVKWVSYLLALSTTENKANAYSPFFNPFASLWQPKSPSPWTNDESVQRGKITYDFPFIPSNPVTLKKIGGDSEKSNSDRLPASERLLIDPSLHLNDPSLIDHFIMTDTVPEEPEEGSVRLQGSQLDYMGRVEVYHNHQWGTVCGFQWDRQDAEVVCRQMGYDTGRVIAVTRPEFGTATDHPVYYNYVDCDGSEEKLADCYAKKDFSKKGLVCNRWRRGATVICGCTTETPAHGTRPRCMVSTTHPFDSYTCNYGCAKGYTLEGVNLRHCNVGQKWDTDLPRCVKTEPEVPQRTSNRLNPETRTFTAVETEIKTAPQIFEKICKRPGYDVKECGFNITSAAQCDANGGCFDEDVKPNCYYPECINPNPCENDGRCISLGKKENPYTCICKDGFVGSRCQFKNIVQTCGRSAYSATNDPAPIPNLFLNEYLNTDFLNSRKRRDLGMFGDDFDILEFLGLRKKPKNDGLDGISNKHLEEILLAGVPANQRIDQKNPTDQENDYERVDDEIKVNFIAKDRKGLLDTKGGYEADTRIVGGREVTSKSQHPWVVMIKIGWRYVCAGVLIAPKWVITAAHCGYEKNIKNNTSPGQSWKIIAGEKSQFEVSDVTVGIEKAIMHDYTHFEDDIPRNDLMLLKLDKELKQTDTINYACLPSNRFDTPGPGDKCTIAGWGVNNEGGDQPEFLNYADIPIMSKEACKKKHTNEKDYESISDDMICAGYDHGGVDACNGDSGGPLMCTRPDNTVYLPGIISWGYECAQADTPGVYTKNSHYLDWIHQTIHDNP